MAYYIALALVSMLFILLSFSALRKMKNRKRYNIVSHHDGSTHITSLKALNPDDALHYFKKLHPENKVKLITLSWLRAMRETDLEI